MHTTTPAAPTSAVPLGTAPDGSPVHWHLSGEHIPCHGLVLGPTRSGASTALERITSGARAAGHTVVWLQRGDRPDPHLRPPRPGAGPTVLVADGEDLLSWPEGAWTRLVRQAGARGLALVVRAHDPRRLNRMVRAHLLAHGQYLALGRLGAGVGHWARVEGLEAAPAPAAPGRGVYGLQGASVPVQVQAP